MENMIECEICREMKELVGTCDECGKKFCMECLGYISKETCFCEEHAGVVPAITKPCMLARAMSEP